jgi:hypothetical protein
MCFPQVLDVNVRRTAISSVTLVSPRKRSASAAGMDVSATTSGSKRQRMEAINKARLPLAIQNGIYAGEKFSDSFSISHVLNLLVESEYVICVRRTKNDTLPR